ncbi:hypothetical protein [Peribacillus muralis]|uniref:hypothetical protein n=1 Tax=Peribacillus muralis TaxID=264697 RepID=UPI003D0268C9
MDNKRFELHFIRTVNEVFDPWELSNFINDFGNEYYKFDLIRNISLELEKGVLPENIIILNNPIKRKYINNEYFDLKNPTMFNSFQSIGYPISLYPNKEILKISLFIRLYKRLNRILNSNIPSTVLTAGYQELQNGSLSTALNNLQNEAIKKLPKNASSTIKNNIKDSKDEIESEYNDYLSQEKHKNDYVKQLKNNEIEYNFQYPDPYFDCFFEFFSKISKPLIGIYLKDEQRIQIIGSKHLKKRKDTLPELDFKRFGHNSPPFFDVATNVVQIGKTIYDTKKEQEVRDEQIKTEKLQQKYLDSQIETDVVKRETLQVRKQILEEQLKQLKENNASGNGGIATVEDDIAKIQNTHIRLNVMDVYHKENQSMTLLLNRNKLKLNESDSKFDIKA